MMILNKSLVLLVLLSIYSLNCGKNPELKFDAEGAMNRWVDMWNSYDLSLVDELFLTDNRLTYLSSEKEGVITGIAAIRQHHRGFGFVEGGKDQDNRLWVENLHAQAFGSTAIVMGTWLFKRGNETSDEIQRGPFTFVFVWDGKDFRIAHANFANYCD